MGAWGGQNCQVGLMFCLKVEKSVLSQRLETATCKETVSVISIDSEHAKRGMLDLQRYPLNLGLIIACHRTTSVCL